MVIVTPKFKKYVKKGVGRVYKVKDGIEYPSVTTVINKTKSAESMQGLDKWKESVGEDVAKWIANESMRMGTKVHELIESYLKFGKQNGEAYPLLANAHFHNIKEYLDKIKPMHNEITLYSRELKIAGTCDCVGNYDGIPSIIDFKTASKAVEDYVHDYMVQATAYSVMVEEQLGMRTSQIVIIMSGRDNSKQVWIKDPVDYMDELKERINRFYLDHQDLL